MNMVDHVDVRAGGRESVSGLLGLLNNHHQ
jgi:hypothetical protein